MQDKGMEQTCFISRTKKYINKNEGQTDALTIIFLNCVTTHSVQTSVYKKQITFVKITAGAGHQNKHTQ